MEILNKHFDAVARDLFKSRGTLATQLLELTPHQFAFHFLTHAENYKSTAIGDRVHELTTINQERGERGLGPIITTWLMRELLPLLRGHPQPKTRSNTKCPAPKIVSKRHS